MDMRTIYLQQLTKVSDFLEVQRKTLQAMATLAFGLFGGTTVAATLPTATTGTQVTNAKPTAASMTLTIPPLSIYQLAQLDPNAWSTLSADTTPLLVQGISAQQNLVLTAPGANSKYVLIEADLGTTEDTNAQVIPYFPMIQTTTRSGSTATTAPPNCILNLTSTQGFTVGDTLIVQGIATVSGVPAKITSIDAGPAVRLDVALASNPGAGVTVRNVNPNSGNPLAGVANDGVAQNIDRVRKVKVYIKDGTPAASPVAPTPTAGRIPLWLIGPIPAGATSITAGMINYAADAPFLPALVGTSHHKGIAGHASKIDVDTELSAALIKKAGDAMLGFLSLHANPSSAMHAVTKQYVDDNYVQLAGDEMTGILGLRPNSIVRLLTSGVTGGRLIFEKPGGAYTTHDGKIDLTGVLMRIFSDASGGKEFTFNLASGLFIATTLQAGSAGLQFGAIRSEPANDPVFGLKPTNNGSGEGFIDVISAFGIRWAEAKNAGGGYTPYDIWKSPVTNNRGTVVGTIAANGYVRFPNSLLVQWGTVTASGGVATANFLTAGVAFANNAYVIVASGSGTITVTGRTTNNASLASSISNGTIHWIAIGV